MSQLTAKIAVHGPSVLFAGSLAAWAASVVGYFPWSVPMSAVAMATAAILRGVSRDLTGSVLIKLGVAMAPMPGLPLRSSS